MASETMDLPGAGCVARFEPDRADPLRARPRGIRLVRSLHLRQSNDSVVFSPNDLHHFLECRHLTALLASAAREGRERQRKDDAGVELLRRRGLEHEAAWLEKQRAARLSIAEVPGPRESGLWAASADATAAAMRNGASIIYQGVFVGDGWRGIADFLVRVEAPSSLGAWSYGACDTKLARHSRYLLQFAYYSEQVARIQERTPRRRHIVLGSGETETFSKVTRLHDAFRSKQLTNCLASISGYFLPGGGGGGDGRCDGGGFGDRPAVVGRTPFTGPLLSPMREPLSLCRWWWRRGGSMLRRRTGWCTPLNPARSGRRRRRRRRFPIAHGSPRS